MVLISMSVKIAKKLGNITRQKVTKIIPGHLEHISMLLRPEQWRLRVDLLHKAGCKCERPHVGWKAGVGPRCEMCDIAADYTK